MYVAKTKALISCADLHLLVLHMQKSGFLMTWLVVYCRCYVFTLRDFVMSSTPPRSVLM